MFVLVKVTVRYFALYSYLAGATTAVAISVEYEHPRQQGSWGQHGPTWVLSAPGGPHDGPINLLSGMILNR